MNLIDIVILVLLFSFAISGIRRGLIWEMLGTVGLVAGILATYWIREDLLNLVVRIADPGWQQEWGAALLFLGFFMMIYFFFSYLGQKIHAGLEKTPFKWPDRVLGIAAGLVKGIIFVGFLVVAMEWVDHTGNVRNYLYRSKLVRWGKQAAYDISHWESEEMRQRV